MSFNAKQAADRLFAIADMIEKQAAEKTFFVCDQCNHTASMSSINGSRAKYASENGIEHVSSISVDDVISCKACGGDMKYAATEESEKFFIEEENETDPSLEGEAEKTQGEDTSEGLDVGDEEPAGADDVVTEDVKTEEVIEDKEEPKKKTPKDKKDSDGNVEMKEEPEVKFGDGEDKKSKTAFDKAVDRYSNF